MDQLNLVSRLQLSFLYHRKVNSRTAAREKCLDDLIIIKLCGKFETRHSGLSDLKNSGSNADLISDAHGRFIHSDRREVLTEHTPWQFELRINRAPEWIMLSRISVHGFVDASMHL